MQIKIQYESEFFGGECDQAVLVIFRYEDGEWDFAKRDGGGELKKLSWDVSDDEDAERDWLIGKLVHGVTKRNQSVAEIPLAEEDGMEYFLIAKKRVGRTGPLKKVGPHRYATNPNGPGQE